MTKVIGVRFRQAGKVYFFSPGKLHVKQGDKVIVETARGLEFGRVCAPNKTVSTRDVVPPLKPVVRIATKEDIKTREEIKRIQVETGITTVFVTHDQEEAMSISDLIVVMKDGVVQQIGKPQEVYDNPENLFVAKFLGTPPINVFKGRVENGKLVLGENAVLDVPGVADRDVTVGIRPEGFNLDENGALVCELSNVEVMGRDISIVSKNEASLNPVIRSIINSDSKVDATAKTVKYSLKPHKVFIFDAKTEERIHF